MPKELLLYGSINEFSSQEFIECVNAIEDNTQPLTMRVNSGGGSPEYGWGMIAKFAEYPGPKNIKVDGQAHSMALYSLCYTQDVEALDVATFTLHRAAYPSWYENDPEYFDEASRAQLDSINKSLRAALEAKIDVAKFEELKGVKLKDVFSMDSRIDVNITAAEAKKIGLIKNVIKITPQKQAEIDSLFSQIMAKHTPVSTNNQVKPKTKNNMTIEQLKAEHPALYAQVVAEGVAQERDRVEACMAFIDIDANGVKAAIESGKPLTQKQMADFTVKALSAEKLKAIEANNPPATPTPTPAINAEEEKAKQAEAFLASARKNSVVLTDKK